MQTTLMAASSPSACAGVATDTDMAMAANVIPTSFRNFFALIALLISRLPVQSPGAPSSSRASLRLSQQTSCPESSTYSPPGNAFWTVFSTDSIVGLINGRSLHIVMARFFYLCSIGRWSQLALLASRSGVPTRCRCWKISLWDWSTLVS